MGLNDTTEYFSAKIADSAQLLLKIGHLLQEQRNSGFFLAGIDSMLLDSMILLKYYKGRKYKIRLLDSVSSGVHNSFVNGSHTQFIQLNDLTNYFNQWIREHSNQGFPFARIRIQEAIIKSDTLFLLLNRTSGPSIVFRQIEQRAKKPYKDFILNRLTSIYPGHVYNHSLVDQIPKVIQHQRAVKLTNDPKVLFLGNEGIVWVYLERNKLNRFDFILGFNPESGLTSKKFRLTGEGGFELVNTFSLNERMFMRYENLSNQSPRLQTGFEFPFIKYIPFGITQYFSLLKYKEEYLDLSNQTGISYPLSYNQTISSSFNFLSSNLLNPDTLSLIRTKRLPSQLDYTLLAIGGTYQWTVLDNRLVPRKGIHLKLDVRFGKKTIQDNLTLLAYESETYKVQEQYDSLNLNKNQALSAVEIDYYLKLTARQSIKLGTRWNSIIGTNPILNNELFRVGGFSSLRGFDEEFFRCSDYVIQTLDYRFFLDQASFINVFSDAATLNQSISDKFSWKFYYSFGIGIQFQTKIGNFNLQYAIGAAANETLNFGNGKIHFGYTNLF